MREIVIRAGALALALGLLACGGDAAEETNAAPTAATSQALAETPGDREFAELTAEWSDALRVACGPSLRDALGTHDLVQGALDGVNDPEGKAKDEIEDATHWIGQGNAELDAVRDRLRAGDCAQDVQTALQQAWQFYVKAGTSAVQAGQIAGG